MMYHYVSGAMKMKDMKMITYKKVKVYCEHNLLWVPMFVFSLVTKVVFCYWHCFILLCSRSENVCKYLVGICEIKVSG